MSTPGNEPDCEQVVTTDEMNELEVALTEARLVETDGKHVTGMTEAGMLDGEHGYMFAVLLGDGSTVEASCFNVADEKLDAVNDILWSFFEKRDWDN